MKPVILIISFLLLNQTEFTPFKKLYEKDGLQINYVYYSEGNGVKDNGVTLFLHNKNEYDVEYSFQLIFRAEKVDKSKEIKGKLKAGEKRTGSNSGLFWIPFEDKRTITELGITKIRIKKLEPEKIINVEDSKL